MSEWKPTVNNLLKRIKLNPAIYGTELSGILSVKEKYIVNYFENRLSKLLDEDIFLDTKYAGCSSCNGNLDNVWLDKSFGLTLEQCFEIIDYISMNIAFTQYGRPFLNWTSSIVILNYIENGYVLCDGGYKFVKDTVSMPLHKYDIEFSK